MEEKWPDDLDSVEDIIEYAADTILLARRCNINSVLKRALYELVCAEGFKQATDSDAEDEDTDSDQSVLNSSDFSLLVRAREQLTMFWMRKAIPPPQPTTCQSPPQTRRHCAVARRRSYELYKELVHDSKLFEDCRYDTIWGLTGLCKAPWVQGEVWPSDFPYETVPTAEVGYLCSACAKEWRAIWRAEQAKLWNDVSIWFELSNGEGSGNDGKE